MLFVGGLLFTFRANCWDHALLAEAISNANACGAMAVTKGAMTALPFPDQLNTFLSSHSLARYDREIRSHHARWSKQKYWILVGACAADAMGAATESTRPAANKDYFGGWVTTLKTASGHVWPLQ